METNNQLTKTNTDSNNNVGLMVIKDEPLLYYSDLKDTDIQKSTAIDDLQKQVLLASLNCPKIRNLDITRGEVGEENTPTYNDLVDIVGLAIWTMGITENSMKKEEQKLFIPLAIQEIKTFPNLSVEDVRIAFNRGARRKYGTMINGELSPTLQMSITTVNIWLTQYTEETKREAMLRLPYVEKEKKKKEDVPKDYSEGDILKIYFDWVNSVCGEYNQFKLNGKYKFVDYQNKFFRYCQILGLMDLTDEQAQDIWDRALKQLKEEYHPKNGRNFGQKIDFKEIYDGLKLDELNKREEELVKIRAKKIAVRDLFIKFSIQKKDLKKVIEEALSKFN